MEQLATTDQKEMFYISLNYYLKLNDKDSHKIMEINDIKTLTGDASNEIKSLIRRLGSDTLMIFK